MKGRRCFVCMDHVDGNLKIQLKKKFSKETDDRASKIVGPVCDLHFAYYAGRGMQKDWPMKRKPVQLELF